MNSPKLNQQIKVKDAMTAAPIINYGGTMGQGKGHTQRLGAAHKKSILVPTPRPRTAQSSPANYRGEYLFNKSALHAKAHNYGKLKQIIMAAEVEEKGGGEDN